jgi:chromosome segregation ATPase
MLDSRLQSFFNDCQNKLEALSKDITSLKRENSELEALVTENERENKGIKFRKDKIQINFDHLCNLDNDLKIQVRRLKEQITKAHNDLCSITKAHQQQRVCIANAESELQTSIHTVSSLKKTRVNSFSVTSKLLDDKISELKSLISSKDQLNTSARLELLEKDLKDSYRVSNILDLQRKFSSTSN